MDDYKLAFKELSAEKKTDLDMKSQTLKQQKVRSRFDITTRLALKEWAIDHN